MAKYSSGISEILRLLRVGNELSCQQMADKLGVSASYISQIENGKKLPSDKMLGLYSKIFGISEHKIIELANPKTIFSKIERQWLYTLSKRKF